MIRQDQINAFERRVRRWFCVGLTVFLNALLLAGSTYPYFFGKGLDTLFVFGVAFILSPIANTLLLFAGLVDADRRAIADGRRFGDYAWPAALTPIIAAAIHLIVAFLTTLGPRGRGAFTGLH